MRTLALLLLLLGALTYTLPVYRELLLPLTVPIGNGDTRYVGAAFVLAGIIALILSRR